MRASASSILNLVGDDEHAIGCGSLDRHRILRHGDGSCGIRHRHSRRVRIDRQGVTIRIQVVAQDVDTHLASRSNRHRVRHGRRVVVLRSRGRNTNAHAGAPLHAEAVLDNVGERVRTGRVVGGRVLQPLRPQHDAALGGRLVNADQSDRVAVRVDAGERHGDARHLPLNGPRAQRLGNGGTVRVGSCHDLERHSRRRAVTHRINDRVCHAHDAGLGTRSQAHLVASHEDRAQLAARHDLHARVNVQRQADRRAVIRQDSNRTNVARAHLGGIRIRLGRRFLALGLRRDDAHLSGRGTRAVGHRVCKRGDVAQARRCGNAQQVTLNEGYLEARVRRHVNRLDDEHATRRVRVIRQRRNQRSATAGQNRQVILGDRHRIRIVGDHVDADDSHSR